MRIKAKNILPLLVAAIGLIGATASLVLINLIVIARPAQLDITLAGDHRLSPRTKNLIQRVHEDFQIVLALSTQSVPDRGAMLRVVDVLTAIADSHAHLDFSLIDLDDPDSAAQTAAVIHALAQRDADQIETRTTLITDSANSLTGLGEFLNSIADELIRVRDTIDQSSPSASTNRAYFDQRAGLLRVAATDLAEVIDTASRELESPTGPIAGPPGSPSPLANTDRFLKPFIDVSRVIDEQLASLRNDLNSFAQAPAIDPVTRDAASPLPAMIAEQRDRIAILVDDLSRAEPIEALRVGTALETGETLLVIGPPTAGTVAVPISALLTQTEVIESVGLSTATWSGQRAEELVASALGSLVNPDPPIMILTHGEPTEGILKLPVLQGLQRRLSQRGIAVAEWAAAVNPLPPTLNSLDPNLTRPRVFVTLNPDSTAGSTGQPDQAGTQRALRFARALQGIADQGEPILFSANPSIFPTYGDTDPITPILEPFGLSLGSGTPILAETVTPQGRQVATDFVTTGDLTPHPISQATHSLSTFLPWPIPITTSGDAAPLLTLSASNSWAEGEWLTLWQTPRANRAALTNQPQPGGLRDHTAASWTLAAAASRPHPETGKAQRLVLVGSNGWYLDPIAERQTAINQQSVLANPGNIELLEAAIFWLAGQDELISPSTTAVQIANVKPLEDSQLALLRWTLLLGLPAAVLGLGIITRLIFG